MNFLQRLLSKLRSRASARRDRKARPEMTAFTEVLASLGPADVALDCGANIGKFSVPMARTGAKVYAFEPNPSAFAVLRQNLAPYPNAQAIHAAVTTTPGPVKLYLHKWAEEDPVQWSTGSSLLEQKNNVCPDHFTLVEGLQLSRFLRETGAQRIRLLKMDIEGAEVTVLNQLLDEGFHEVIEQAFVEVHDRRVPELVEPTRQLRARLAALGAVHFRLDWR